jgi:hypothetical protein
MNSNTGTKWASNLHKYQKEDVEQIDELSKGTVLSYTHKAGRSMGKHIGNAAAAKDIAKYSYDGETADQIKKKHIDKANKRAAGIDAASKRLAKEDVEQIDEISMDYLRKKDYMHKAEVSRKDAENTTRQYWKSPEEKQKARETADKRTRGIGAYSDRLYKTMKKPEYKSNNPMNSYPLGGHDPKSNRSYSE